jgi:hypothetical protein
VLLILLLLWSSGVLYEFVDHGVDAICDSEIEKGDAFMNLSSQVFEGEFVVSPLHEPFEGGFVNVPLNKIPRFEKSGLYVLQGLIVFLVVGGNAFVLFENSLDPQHHSG